MLQYAIQVELVYIMNPTLHTYSVTLREEAEVLWQHYLGLCGWMPHFEG